MASDDGDLLAGGTGFQCRVSSVLNRNVKEFGKKHLFDGKEDTCWNSEQGSPQWVHVVFDGGDARTVSEIELVFQGGFVGKACSLEVSKEGDINAELAKCLDFYPEDTNKPQIFKLDRPVLARSVRVVFSDSTDFFGRITLYSLKLK